MIVNTISYPGNKNKLLSQIIPELPSDCSQIVEIFCGSGVVSINSNITLIQSNIFYHISLNKDIFLYKKSATT